MKRSLDTYGDPQIIKTPGFTIRLYRPILTDEERTRRMKSIMEAASALILAQIKSENN